ASDQVVVAMTQVADVSRQYAAGSKQTAAASAQITMLAAAMQDSISRFQVDDDQRVPEVQPRDVAVNKLSEDEAAAQPLDGLPVA
ncbi:MAG: hypothetical protein ABI720_05600, partial [Actinomycetes bacterium]